MNTSSMISATLHQATDLHNIALSGWLTRVNLEALATIWLLFPLVGGYFMQSETLRDDNGNNAGLNRTPAKIANGYTATFFRPATATTQPQSGLNQSATPKCAG